MTAIPAAEYFTDPNRTNGEAKQAQDDMLEVLRELPGGSAEAELTISSGSVTPTASAHSVDTEGDAASDDLTTIATDNHPDGRLLLVRAASSAREVVVKHNAGGAGQVALSDGADLKLRHTSMWLLLKRTGTDWEEVARSYGANKVDALAFRAPATDAALTSGGAANVYTLTYPVAPAAYVAGVEHVFKPVATNVGTSTLNVNGLGAKNIYRPTPAGAKPLLGGELQAGQITKVMYDGTQFVITSPFCERKPGFHAHKNNVAQTGITSGAATKVTYGTEDRDYGGYYDAANSRFQPLEPGIYRITALASLSAGFVTGASYILEIYKNGAQISKGPSFPIGNNSTTVTFASMDVEFNGSTDYIEIFIIGSSGTISLSGSPADSWFQAIKQ